MIGAAGRASSSSSLSGAVTPGRPGAATPMSGEASRRSSPLATALTPSTRMGRAVHRGEVNCRTAWAVVLVGARSPSPWSSSSSQARACGRCARLSSGRPRRREARSWGGLRRLNRGLSVSLPQGERPSTVRSTEAGGEAVAGTLTASSASGGRAMLAHTDAGSRVHGTAHMTAGVRHEKSGRCREAPTAVFVAVADQMIITGIPRRFALSIMFPVIPLPGNAITPLGSRLSRSSLRLKGAALP